MGRVAEFERRLWLLDQKINARGCQVDTGLARRAADACAREKLELDRQVTELSQGAITSATQREKVKVLLQKYGVDLPNMQAGTLELVADDDDLAAEARILIEARQRVSKASTAKFLKILSAVGPDGRLRGALQYAGAARTSRWAGRIFQPHNMPRPKRPLEEIVQGILALKLGAEGLITDNVHELCSDALRSLLIARKGYQLSVADYNAIEGRGLAWLGGETWKLEAYLAEVDMYVQTYRQMFGLPNEFEVDSFMRQQGKVFELAFGYEGGVKALIGAAVTYGVDLKALAEGAWSAAPTPIRSKAKNLYEFAVDNNNTHGLSRKLYIQLESAKLMWRKAAPATVALWKKYKRAAMEAVKNPGRRYLAGKCVFCVRAKFLTVRLPSGRLLLYAKPRLSGRLLLYAKPRLSKDGKLSYVGTYGGRQYLYGGKLAENITQAVSRDILAFGLLRVEAAGFLIVMHIHDEIIAEVRKGGPLTVERMSEIMEVAPPWADGFPLKAKGYQAFRYKKD